MKFKNKKEAVELLSLLGLYISEDEEIVYPLGAEHEDEVHDCIDYLISEHGFGIKYA